MSGTESDLETYHIRQNRACIVATKAEEPRIIEIMDSDPEEAAELSLQAEVSTQALEDREADFENSPKQDQSNLPTPAEKPEEDSGYEADDGGERNDCADEFDEEDNFYADKNKEFVRSNAPEPEKETHKEDSDSNSDLEESASGQGEQFRIDTRLHESYIKMLQKNISNEEWDAFCVAERNRLQRDKHRWLSLNEDTDEDENSSDTTKENPPPRQPSTPPQIASPLTQPGPSHPSDNTLTLRTQSPTPPPPQQPTK